MGRDCCCSVLSSSNLYHPRNKVRERGSEGAVVVVGVDKKGQETNNRSLYGARNEGYNAYKDQQQGDKGDRWQQYIIMVT